MGRPERNQIAPGTVFSRLTAERRVQGTPIRWECSCVCGSTLQVLKTHLVKGLVQSCGCLKKDLGTALGLRNACDITGMTFGRLTAISRIENVRDESQWAVQCACGATDVATPNQLSRGKKTQCSTCSSSSKRTSLVKHGETTWKGPKTQLYCTWLSLRNRCNNPKHRHYENYGGRGIKVDPRWDDFSAFRSDMGERPSPEHSIERRNNDADYGPENCVRATTIEQANNRRNNSIHLFQGELLTLMQLSRLTGMDYRLLQSRLQRGWSVDEAVSRPKKVGVKENNNVIGKGELSGKLL